MSGYDQVTKVTKLPKQMQSEARYVNHGYAACINQGSWFFFDSLLPALAFGRAARMSAQCSSYTVVEAAHEARSDEAEGKDRRVLHVTDRSLDRADNEREQLRRWADGVDPASAHWRGTAT